MPVVCLILLTAGWQLLTTASLDTVLLLGILVLIVITNRGIFLDPFRLWIQLKVKEQKLAHDGIKEERPKVAWRQMIKRNVIGLLLLRFSLQAR